MLLASMPARWRDKRGTKLGNKHGKLATFRDPAGKPSVKLLALLATVRGRPRMRCVMRFANKCGLSERHCGKCGGILGAIGVRFTDGWQAEAPAPLSLV